MDTIQILLISLALIGAVAMLVVGLIGTSPAREAARRLQAVRLRHSDSTLDKVEAQLRKAVASRRPRLTGKNGWPPKRDSWWPPI